MLTVAYIASFLALGWVEGQFGPTFPDLRLIAHATLEEGSLFFTMGTVGYLLGSLLTGFLFDRRVLDRNLLMFIATAGYGVIIAIIPWCGLYEVMVIIHIVKGAFGGGLDTCGNAGMVVTWGNEGDAYFNALHFAFAVGGILSPLATAPYVMSLDNNNHVMNRTTFNSTSIKSTGLEITENMYDVSNLSSSRRSIEEQTSLIYVPYAITTGVCFLTSLPFIVFCCISLQKTLEKEKKEDEEENKKKSHRRLRIVGFINMVVYIAVYVAVENCFAGFLTTFVTSQLHWSNADGSYITSGYWSSFAVGRFLGIFLVRWFSPAKMIFAYNCALLLSLLGFLLTSQYDVIYGVWIFSILIGLSMSVIFPTVFMWTEQKFLKVTGKIASLFLVAASVGFMVNPPIVSVLMEKFTPMWFSYLLFGETAVLFVLYFSGLFISRKIASKHPIMADQELTIKENID
ncbi:sodium-dependent glucose transporter 1-like isoform X2 [Saccostrea echinata]|uniref:sodium-dependent glucose transporter 1-like isoform X2 n=1 Tax=Saccostrea echinata TaxID=191078 RepID=UPI002A83FC18|nr:sodium-dependent glucose transporter 1-like isoform X2 [Saccostrea echinata]